VAFAAGVGLLLGGRGAARTWGGAALALPALALSPWPGGAVLAAMGPLVARGSREGAFGPVVVVTLGVLAAAEGLRAAGAGAPLPTVDASPGVPEVVHALPPGPLLELPLGRGAARRALAAQLEHRRAVSVDRAGQPVAEAMDLGRVFAGGGCADPGALGYAGLVVRREAELRNVANLRACLGTPLADDGTTAVWALVAPPHTSR
jgi:hypothetical protein